MPNGPSFKGAILSIATPDNENGGKERENKELPRYTYAGERENKELPRYTYAGCWGRAGLCDSSPWEVGCREGSEHARM